MNWDAVGAVGEIIGATGVILSLAYLALQIRQNSRLLTQNTAVARASSSVTSASYGSDFTRTIALHPTAARIWATGNNDIDRLNDEERRTYDLLLISQIIQVDVNHYLHRAGTLDAEIYGIWDRILDGMLENPRFQTLWNGGVIDNVTTDSLSAAIREKLDARNAAKA